VKGKDKEFDNKYCIKHAFSVPATAISRLVFLYTGAVLHDCLSDLNPCSQDTFLALRVPQLSGRFQGFHPSVILLIQHHPIFPPPVAWRICTAPYRVVFWRSLRYRVPVQVKDASKQRPKGSDAAYNHAHAVLSISPYQHIRDTN
jgi:hypothetical protein